MSAAVITETTVEEPRPLLRRMRRGSGHRPQRGDIEGLRAIAVGLVVLYHADLGPFTGGYVGVDVFFVISGFLITSLMVREFDRTQRISISGFYARRLRRIVPAGTLTIIVTVVASGIVLGDVRITAIAHDGVWASGFLANFRFMATGTNYLAATAPPSPLQHFWSLAVEEQFYIVWPLLLLGLLLLGQRWRRGHPHTLVAGVLSVLVAASVWFCIAETSTNATRAYFSPWSRAWELGAGALLALAAGALVRLTRLAAAGLALLGAAAILVSALAYTDDTRFPGAAALLPVAGAVLLLAAGCAPRQSSLSPSGLLGIAPLRWIGGLSYTIYLWHWPILIIVEQRYGPVSAAGRAGLVVAAVLLSVLTHHLIENPIRFAPTLTGSRLRAIAVGCVIVLTGAAFTNAYVVMANGRVDAAKADSRIAAAAAKTTFIDAQTVEKAVAASAKITKLPSGLNPPLVNATDAGSAPCYAQLKLGPGQMCYLGDKHAKQTIVLYGDSHAGMWSYPLDVIAQRAHFKLVLVTRHGCPIADISFWSSLNQAPDTACDAWHRIATAKIKSMQVGLVFLTGEAYEPLHSDKTPVTGAEWSAGLAKTIDAMSVPGRKFDIIGDTPYLDRAATDCLSVHTNDVQACSTPRDKAVRTVYRDAERQVAKQVGARYIDPVPWLCTKVCSPVIHNILVYKDKYHLTSLYTSYLAGSLADAVKLGKAQ